MNLKLAKVWAVISLFLLGGCQMTEDQLNLVKESIGEIEFFKKESTAISSATFSSVVRANGGTATSQTPGCVGVKDAVAVEYVVSENNSKYYRMIYFRFETESGAEAAFNYLSNNLEYLSGDSSLTEDSEVKRIAPIYMGNIKGNFEEFDAQVSYQIIRIIRHDKIILKYIGYALFKDESPTIFGLLGY